MTIINNISASIDTVAPALKIGEIQISADRRTTKEKPLTDAERIRRAVLPANHWGILAASADGNTSQGLTDILTNGLKAIANSRLKDYLEEQPLARTIALADYTVTALLAWSTDTASSRGALTFERADVEAWFPTSLLGATMKAKSQAHYDLILQRLAALAAKNHGLKKPEDCTKLTVMLAEDAAPASGAVAHPLVSELIQRLAHIEKAMTARSNDKVLSLDDL
jgi:hypothetical protein